jgi:hypothetical protein
VVGDDARQAFANPRAGLRPRHVLPQPTGGVRLDNLGVLFHEDLPNRVSDFLHQLAIGLAAAVETPRIAPAGNHPADVKAGIRDEQHFRHSERAALCEEAEDAALDREPRCARFRGGEPCDVAVGQR